MNKLLTATAMALALGLAGGAWAQTSNDARGGEAMAQTQSGQTQTTQPQARQPSTTQPSTPSGTQAGTSGQQWYGQMSADELIGRDVVNANGEQVGDIEDIVMDAQGEAMYAVVSVGGFLGMGEKEVALPFDQLRLGADDAILMSEQSEEQLEQMPAYEETRYKPVERGQPLSSMPSR